MAALIFTISPNSEHRSFSKTVENGSEHQQLELFTSGSAPYSGEWIAVDNDVWIRRDAIVTVRFASEGPMVAVG